MSSGVSSVGVTFHPLGDQFTRVTLDDSSIPLLPIARLAYTILTCRPSRSWRRILASPRRRRLRGRPLACCPLAPRPLSPPCPRRRSPPTLHHESPKPIWPCPPRTLPHRQLELRVDRFPCLSAPPIIRTNLSKSHAVASISTSLRHGSESSLTRSRFAVSAYSCAA